LAVFGGYWPRKLKFFQWDPKKALPWWKRIVWAINHGNRFTGLTCGGEQENNMKGKERDGKMGRDGMHKKSQKCYILRSHGGGSPGAISMKFWPLVYMVNVINSAKFDHCSFNGLSLAMVQNLPFSHA
jgi:hypothetical protein